MADIGCGCYNSIAIPVGSGVPQIVTFDTDRWDTDGMHTAPGVLTCATAGKYLVTGHTAYANAGAVGERETSILRTVLGAPWPVAAQSQDAFAGINYLSVSTIIDLGVGDTLNLLAFQNTGAPVNLLATLAHSSEFTAQMLEDVGCRAYRNALVSIPDSVWTAVGLNAERWDTDGCHDNAVNNSRITCQTEGYYAMTANAAFNPQISGNRAVRIRLSGTTTLSAQRIDANGTSNSLSCESTYYMTVGDYIEMEVLTVMGVPQNLQYYQEYSPDLAMQLISAA